ncbi:hypothetical protein [Legionella hackeliae]|uniref:Uncharacterized protein n=1 Tax=Legionella hackeliae TaxID=449 RepID=A0A0A8UMH3_LEGHA|nr:hypothetical protein [Legionella hackeliae]KTD10552.1 hypothetical protein Lhac_2920 [Legionella hackeliae]CEK10055.1 protein of unknown function [Legionella hackeliae]STX46781.1 Uncharacterised protein [Legionella hackeliae]
MEEKIEALRPEIRASMVEAYKKVHKITEVSEEQEGKIDIQVKEYMEAFKGALAVNYTDPMVNAVERSLESYVATYTGAPISEFNSSSLEKLQKSVKRNHIRERILELNPEDLPQDEKYKIMHYVNTHYKNDPDYVAAVRYILMGGHEKIGGLAGSIKIALSYVPALFRAGVGLIMSAGFGLGSLINPDLRSRASMALQPVNDLLNKARADTGLIIKAISNLGRVTWGLIGSILRVPLVAIYSLVASPVLITQYLTSSRHYLPTPREMNGMLSEFLFAPGKVSQLLNAVNGFFREAAGAKNLEAATAGVTAQEMTENIAQLRHDKLLTTLMSPQAINEQELSTPHMLDTLRKVATTTVSNPTAEKPGLSAIRTASESKSVKVFKLEDVTHSHHPLMEEDSEDDEGESTKVEP